MNDECNCGVSGCTAHEDMPGCHYYQNPHPKPDRRFLGGETAVLTDTSTMALVIAVGHDGACDIVCNIANAVAVKALESVIAHIKSKPDNFTPSPSPALQEDPQP